MMQIPAATSRRLLGAALISALLAPASAAASIGTGVGAVPLTLAAPAHAGRSYTFRWLYVKDTGTVASDYKVSAHRLSPGSEKDVPTGWIDLEPRSFRLEPRGVERVTVTVSIPASVSAGAYLTDLVATTYAPHRAGATALGAAAADRLAFTIPSSSSFPWIIAFVVGAAATVLGLSLRLVRSRRRPAIRHPM
jgi:hypothetical protein